MTLGSLLQHFVLLLQFVAFVWLSADTQWPVSIEQWTGWVCSSSPGERGQESTCLVGKGKRRLLLLSHHTRKASFRSSGDPQKIGKPLATDIDMLL